MIDLSDLVKGTGRKLKESKFMNYFNEEHTSVFQALKENGVVPEADLLLVVLRFAVPGSATFLDSGGDDIQQQGPPAQAEGGAQEDVQGEEVLGQGQLRPVNPSIGSISNARVSIADD